MNFILHRLARISEWLKLPELRGIEDIDDPMVTELHKQIIQRKKFLKRVYIDWYTEFTKVTEKIPSGPLVELGSGRGFLKSIIPDVITSDVLFLSGTDMNFSVSHMPFKNNTINAFFMLNVLHHINDPHAFLKELDRCLNVGGKIVMIEPANTLVGRFIWKNFHHEHFDATKDWGFEGNGPLSAANGAIPWIIFFRDRARFNKEFPMLKVKKIQLHTSMRYLLSGGVSIRQLLPSFTYNIVKILEFILSPFNKYIAMFLTIEIEKQKDNI